MKKIILTLVLGFFCLQIFSQTAVGTPEQLEQFYKTTTYVVLEKNPMLQYNSIIKKTVEKHWKITPYKFVTFSTDEFEKARLDPNKSFLIMHNVNFEKDKTKANYKYLYIVLGGNYEIINQMPEIANVPVAYDDMDEGTYDYKLGMLCQFLQKHIELTKSNPSLNKKNILKYYYKNITADMHEKTLYITKDVLAKNFKSMSEIKKYYPYKLKLVEKSEIKKAIDSFDKNVVFVHKVGPEGSKRKARCFNTIVGAGEPQLYYFSYHMISDKKPEGLTKKDWKKMGKAKKNK